MLSVSDGWCLIQTALVWGSSTKLMGRNRVADVITLDDVAAFASQEGFLFGRFTPSDHHVKAQAVGHGDHGVDQLGIAVVAGQIVHEAAVNLELRTGKRLR